MRTPSTDSHFMRRALALARRAEGFTRPNPPVGALLVHPNGSIIGEGWHHQAGHPHAEVEAFLDAERRSLSTQDATLYVTLEPCSTTGRTPPCTSRILASGVSRVVVGSLDANPLHAGRGLDLLRAAGISVTQGVLSSQTDALLAPFFHWIQHHTPFLTLKMAASLDGAIADSQGHSQWISCETSRRAVQRLRRAADAVLIGSQTALSDNPSLLCRLPHYTPTGIRRIILDSSGHLPTSLNIFSDGHANSTVIATTPRTPTHILNAWTATGASVWVLPPNPSGHVDLPSLLQKAGSAGLMHLLCEGGATLAGNLIHAHLVDELQLFLAPIVLGARTANVFGSLPFPLASAPHFSFLPPKHSGSDLLLIGHPQNSR